MKCAYCGNEKIVDSRTTYYRNVDNMYFIIENVPCKICSQCGEVLYNMSDIDIIDRIIEKELEKKEKINLCDFNIAA